MTQQSRYEVGMLEDGSIDCFLAGTNDGAVQRFNNYKPSEKEQAEYTAKTMKQLRDLSLRSNARDVSFSIAIDYLNGDNNKTMSERYGKTWARKARTIIRNTENYHGLIDEPISGISGSSLVLEYKKALDLHRKRNK